jgi:hypothetical protein
VRLVLDEMWSPAIAVQLRLRGHDVISAQEPDHHPRYGGISDELVFERAQQDGRAIVTDNIEDYEQLVADCARRGAAHHGVVFCSSRQFDRSDRRTVGRIVDALDAFLTKHADTPAPFNRRHWLRRTT